MVARILGVCFFVCTDRSPQAASTSATATYSAKVANQVNNGFLFFRIALSQGSATNVLTVRFRRGSNRVDWDGGSVWIYSYPLARLPP